MILQCFPVCGPHELYILFYLKGVEVLGERGGGRG